MNIRILDSWLREYLKTDATPQEISNALSLTSVSVEKIERYKNGDYIYDIEITTNRVDLMSILGLAREACAVLPEFGFKAKFISKSAKETNAKPENNLKMEIKNNPKLVNRICAAVMDVELKDSPEYIKNRLEASGIRSLNNLVDVTNYIMREIGHPAHVFDYDRIKNGQIIIREAKKGEKIVTLDKKNRVLSGGDIVADNGKGEIIDLLGVMGAENSVVTKNTKKILFFIDNNDPAKIRKTSMSLSLRSEAATINEKTLDPELAMQALLRGIELYREIANGKLSSEIIDIYPNKPSTKNVNVREEKIKEIIGVDISLTKSKEILEKLGFKISLKNDKLEAIAPSWRQKDITIEEDLIEEIARIYGYYKIPGLLPPLSDNQGYTKIDNEFYWEKRAKDMLKYWGFSEVYTYSLVSEEMLEGAPEKALKIANPLSLDMLYLRTTLIPSLLQAVKENQDKEVIKIFEIANIYKKNGLNLPNELQKIAVVIKNSDKSFFYAKGIIEQMFFDLGIKNFSFRQRQNGGAGADVYIENDFTGEIEILQANLVNFELNFQKIVKKASLKKVYRPIGKFPPVIEDIRLIINQNITYQEIVNFIKKQSKFVKDVLLLDVYENKKTFRIKYQDKTGNLTNEQVTKERNKIIKLLKEKLDAEIS